MRDMARWGIANARWSSDPWNRARSLYKTLAFDAGPVLAPAVLVLLPWTLRSRRNRMATGAVAAVTAGTLLVNFFQSHYLAPVAPLVVLLMAASLRRLALLRFGGGGTGAAIGAVLLGATVLNAAREWVVEARAPERMTAHWAASREQIAEALAQAGGGHVVFVRYGPHHNRHMEVVFNGAGVDGAPVVWVRDLGPEQNGVDLRYFPDRVAWLLNIENDLPPARLVPYPSGGSAVRGRSPAGSD